LTLFLGSSVGRAVDC